MFLSVQEGESSGKRKAEDDDKANKKHKKYVISDEEEEEGGKSHFAEGKPLQSHLYSPGTPGRVKPDLP